MAQDKVGAAPLLDIAKYPRTQAFVKRCREFFDDIKDLTPGKNLEVYLNREYGPGKPFYEDLCSYIKEGLKEGWVANAELDRPKYRRSRIMAPPEYTHYIGITTVYMESQEVHAGQYHAHPYGEINCVVQLDETAELKGMQGGQKAGWTCPGPGTHHYPEVRGGALFALFFLPAGRISYRVTPDMPQPHCV